MSGMRTGLTIGEFATVTHLSVPAQVIHQLRELDVPLAEIKAILATDDPQQRTDLIAGHLRRLEDTLERTRGAVAALRQLLRADDPQLRVELRSVPARTVAAISGDVQLAQILGWYDGAMAELDAAYPVSERTGPPGGRYANELFTGGAGAATVYRPVGDPHAFGRIEVVSLPATELAITVHSGTTDDIDVIYGRLGAWVVGHALAVDGPIHETYLVGARDTEVPAHWRTEIGWPIFRLTPA